MNALKELQQKILNECDIKTTLIHYGCKDNGDGVNMECGRHKSKGKHSLSVTDGVCNCVNESCDLKGNIYSIIILYEGWNKSEFYSHTLPKACEIYGYDMPKLSEKEIKMAMEKKTRRDIILKSHKVFFEFAKKEKEQIFPYVKKKRQITKKEFDSLELGFLFEEAYSKLRKLLKKEIPDIDSVFHTDESGKKHYLKDAYYLFINRIVHPHYFNGDILFFVGENYPRPGIKKSMKYVKLNVHFAVNRNAEGYILDSLNSDDKEYIIISEGYWDALKLKLCGVNTVSFGTCAISQYFIDTYYIQLKKFKKIVISFDVEENQAGISGAISLAKRLAIMGVENIFISQLTTTKDGKLDIDEWLSSIKQNERKMKIRDKIINASKPFINFMFSGMKGDDKEEATKEIIGYAETLNSIPKNEIKNKLEKDFNISKSLYKEILEEIYAFKKEYKEANDSDTKEKLKHLFEVKDIKNAIYELSNYFLDKYYIKTTSDFEEIYIYDNGIYIKNGEAIIKKETQILLEVNGTNHIINEILGQIKRSTLTNREDFKEDKNYLCVENGLLDLKILSLEEFTPEKIFLNKLPIKFDKTAKCEKFKKFLNEMMNKDDIPILQEYYGYVLRKDVRYQKALMLYGEGGDNGKSVILTHMKNFIGWKNCAAVALQTLDENRFAPSWLYNKMANIFADIPGRAMTGSSMFKMITVGDNITLEKKGFDGFETVLFSKLIFSANELPQTIDDTRAFFRRWIIIVFNIICPANKIDRELDKKISTEQEMSGALNWAIEGLKRLDTQKGFSNSKSVDDVEKFYVMNSDSIAAFVTDKVWVINTAYIPKSKLFEKYNHYCIDNDIEPKTENVFHRELQKKVKISEYRPKDSVWDNQIRCWEGIWVNDEPLEYDWGRYLQ